MISIILIVLVLTIIYFKIIKVYSYWSDRGVKQRKQTYLLGDSKSLFFKKESPLDFALNIYKEFPDERYMGIYQFVTPTFGVRDPELIKRITVKDFDHFTDHNSVVPDEIDPLWNRNLFSLKGDKWHDMRSTLSPSFTTSKMKIIFSLISECAATFMEYLGEMDEDVISIELKDACTRFTNDVIATSAFGIKCNSLKERENEFYLMGKKATNFVTVGKIISFMFYTLAPPVAKAFGYPRIFNEDVSDFFTTIITDTIRTRTENNIIRPDMLHLLLEARKGNQKNDEHQNDLIDTGFATVEESKLNTNRTVAEAKITDVDITAQALIFFFAGFETVSTAMCFMGHELTVNPLIRKKLLQEVDETFKECKGVLTYEALMKMPYMDMVVSETLRKWPPGPPMDRVCTKPYTIELINVNEKVVHLQVGDFIFIPVVGLHRDPKYFQNPDVFDPERFNDENKHTIQPYTYFPFGLGPRNCIGSRFALMEVKALFFHLLSKFESVPVEKTQIPLKLARSFTVTAENGFWIGLKKRTIAI